MKTTETKTTQQKVTTMDPTPPATDIKLLMENALLVNNEKQRLDFELSFDKFAAKVSADISTQNKVFADQVFNLTGTVTTHEGRLNAIDSLIVAIKTRIAVVGSVCTALGGLVGFFISQLVK